ncbi:MAG: hypothetical protein AAF687_06170 [Pseudomonadota bacterium]
MLRFMTIALAAIGLSLTIVPQSHAQLGGILREIAPEVKLPNLLKGKPPITTSIQDAIYADPNRDGFDPGVAQDLTSLPLDSKNRFVLAPGYYTMTAQSYCLKAGTYGPTSGDAYLYAPLKGPQRKAVDAILRNSVDNPDIAQRDIQVLLWAIIARAKFENLNTRTKAIAARLLSTRQLASLNRNAIDVLTSSQVQGLIGGVPGPVATVLEAEADMRRMLSTGSSYGDLEAVAVLAGMAPLGEGSLTNIPSNRWSRHPKGFWVRFDPSGYSRTVVEIYVPEDADGEKYDPADTVAVPTNTSKQRLGQSARVYGA